jgi:hypothetical protein
MNAKHLVAFLLVMLALGTSVMIADAQAPRAQGNAPKAVGTEVVVNTDIDEYNTGPNCSLREAVTTQNTGVAFGGCSIVTAGGPGDRIFLQANTTYTLTIAGIEDSNISGDLDITNSVIISGVSSTINGNGLDRVISFIAGSSTLKGVTIRGGVSSVNGSGIFNVGTLALSNCTVSNNSGSGGVGSGIRNQGTMTIDSCTITHNTGATYGGGIDQATGALTVTNSSIFSNSVSIAGGGIHKAAGTMAIINSTVYSNTAGSFAGGIWNDAGGMVITNSTISQNFAVTGSGGIYNQNIITITGSSVLSNTATAGTAGGLSNQYIAALVNTTFSGNQTRDSGGGIFNSVGATATLYNATVTNNTADRDNLGGSDGGGIYQAGAGSTSLYNSIVAGNLDLSGGGPDCVGVIRLQGYNLIGDTTSCTTTILVGGDILDTSALLGPLANNGGTTLTHALLKGSPAINAGNPTGCVDWTGALLTTDQRGFGRHLSARCDMGAFEYPAELFLPLILK